MKTTAEMEIKFLTCRFSHLNSKTTFVLTVFVHTDTLSRTLELADYVWG